MSAIAGEAEVQGRARAVGLPVLAALIVLGCGAFGLAALWPILDEAWSNIYGPFSHGYLALGLCIWLAIRYWRAVPPQQLQPAWPAVLPLAALVFALVGMDILFLNSPRTWVLPLVFLAAVALTFGWSAARTLFWPSMFLFVALPQWWAINGVLQTLTSTVVSVFVSLTGLPAYVEGNFIRVPAGMFEIASGCSGLNYLVAALSLAGFYALMYLERWKSRWLLLAAAAAAAMLSNFIRIYSLIVIGIVSDMQHYLIRVEHLYFGWVLFMLTMIPVLWFARKLDDTDAAAVTTVPTSATPKASIAVANSVVPAALVSGLILLLPQVVTIRADSATVQAPALPAQLGSWKRSDATRSAWQPAFVNAHEERTQYVDSSQSAVDVYRAAYSHQTYEARVIRTENDFFGGGWRLAEQHTTQVDVPSIPQMIESRGYLDERERVIWSWYVVAGKAVVSKLGAKLEELRGFAQRRRDASAVAISTECIPDCEAARARLTTFMQQSAASLQ